MKKIAFKQGRFPSRLSVSLLLIIVLLFFTQVKELRSETGLPAAAIVEKTVDLGIIESEPAILGRDGGYSVRFQSHSIWIYGDTVIRQNDHSDPLLLSNSCSRTMDRNAGDGLTGFKPCRDTNEVPGELFPFTAEELAFNREHQSLTCPSEPCGSRWALWPGAAVSDSAANRLVLFFKKVLVKPEILNFETKGHAMAVWRKLDEPPERIQNYPQSRWPGLMFGETEPAFGSAAVVVQSIVYVFGCNLEGFSKPCRLARVPLADITDRRAWEFYGTSQKWQKDIDSCQVVLNGNDMMSVSYNHYLERYLAAYSQPMSTGVMLRTAKNIEGPWSQPYKAFAAKEPENTIGWIYDAMEHPEYAEKNGKVIYITYSRQTGPLTFEMRLVRITLKRS